MKIKEYKVADEIVQALFKSEFSSTDVEFGVVTIPPGERLPIEGTTAHEEHEYSFIIKGSLIGESGGEAYTISAGEGSYIPAGEAHWCVNESDSSCQLVFALVKAR